MHDEDKILEYYAFGAGECCLVMAALNYFCYNSLDPIITNQTCMSHVTKYYLEFQIATWVMWFLTELYYTVTRVEWPVVGSLHVVLCSIVLYQAYDVYSLIY